jgi:hypothetical protein
MGQFLEVNRGPTLVTRDRRRLDQEEIKAVIAEARECGLLATADRWALTPGDLYRVAIMVE